MSDKEIEKEIQEKNLNAPRLNPELIKSKIESVTYTKLPSGKAMVCELTLRNGFTIRGESACVSKENFDQEIGEKISYGNAFDRIWLVEGYLLQEKLHQEQLLKPKKPKMITVESSSIRRLGWIDDQLTVEFKGGGVYVYDEVSESDYFSLMDAESVGRHFNQHIKNSYEWVKK